MVSLERETVRTWSRRKTPVTKCKGKKIRRRVFPGCQIKGAKWNPLDIYMKDEINVLISSCTHSCLLNNSISYNLPWLLISWFRSQTAQRPPVYTGCTGPTQGAPGHTAAPGRTSSGGWGTALGLSTAQQSLGQWQQRSTAQTWSSRGHVRPCW